MAIAKQDLRLVRFANGKECVFYWHCCIRQDNSTTLPCVAYIRLGLVVARVCFVASADAQITNSIRLNHKSLNSPGEYIGNY